MKPRPTMKNKIAISFLLTAAVSISLNSVSAQDNFVSQNPDNVNPVNTVAPPPPTGGPCSSGCTPTIPVCPPEGQGVVEWRGGGAYLWSVYYPAGMWKAANYTVRSLYLEMEQPAGWYNIYQKPKTWVADSGDHQRNESTFLSVPNGFNPKGRPHSSSLTDQNRCHGFAIMRDFDNDFLRDSNGDTIYPPDIPNIFAGTFYLTPGHNWAMVSQFCKLKNIMGARPGCDGIEDTGNNNDPAHEDHTKTTLCNETTPTQGNWGSHWGTVQSIGYDVREGATCALSEANLGVPSGPPVPEPLLDEDFTGNIVGEDWVGTYESDADMDALKYHNNFEWISGLKIPNHNPNIAGVGAPQSGQWSTDRARNLFDNNNQGSERRTLFINESEGPSFIHYLPNDIDEEYFELSWKNYVYTGAFRLRNFDSSGTTAITHSFPSSFGPTVYSEFPYFPMAYSLRSTDGGPFILDGINIGFNQIQGFIPGSTPFATGDNYKDTGVIPQRGVWYAFKIDTRTTLGGVFVRAKIWESNVLGNYVPVGGPEPTWSDIETEEPSDYGAHIFTQASSRHGAGPVGMEYTDGQGGMHVDYLRVRPTNDVYPGFDPFNWHHRDW
jgi:hypothetical protein